MLKKMRSPFMPTAYIFQEIMIDGEEALVFMDGNLEIMEQEEAKDVLAKLIKGYKNEDVNKSIKEHNKERQLLHAGFDFENQGRYYRFNHPVYSKKEFRKDLKRNWSFKCGWCGKKVSSEFPQEYYTIMEYSLEGTTGFERGCSEVCIKHIWDELLTNWLKEHGYDPQKYGL
ncbi:hypothetical protein M4D58_23715 [Brevibacillus borstelensis]|uniref:hypothetical protein n=1 Tax=Brevibacillus borstelensis TaxID=45462 RepID=UPI00203E7A32|nr:hypothetical protein [Brevibacillus borstelensis]MCM3593633.1 hypothetical protein [Brevibacillus borstelensis]